MQKEYSATRNRIQEIDLVKCMCIILMVSFHLVYVEQQFPHTKDFVYLFHMPAFLVISGYFATSSSAKVKAKLRYLGITYLLMESAYIVMAAFLPINEHLPCLTTEVFLQKLFVSPIGPYWYLHALIVCSSLYCILYNTLSRRVSDTSFQILFLTLLSVLVGTFLSINSVVFFGLGVIIKMAGKGFLHIVRPSIFAIIPLVMIFLNQTCAFPICNAMSSDILNCVLRYSRSEISK